MLKQIPFRMLRRMNQMPKIPSGFEAPRGLRSYEEPQQPLHTALPTYEGANLGAHLGPPVRLSTQSFPGALSPAPQPPQRLAPLNLRETFTPLTTPLVSDDFEEMFRELFEDQQVLTSAPNEASSSDAPKSPQRLDAVKERNRRAQKRFREKMKAKNKSQEEELRYLRHERERLQFENADAAVKLHDARQGLEAGHIAYQALLVQLQRVNVNRIELETYISELTAVMNYRDEQGMMPGDAPIEDLPPIPELASVTLPDMEIAQLRETLDEIFPS